MRELQLPAGRLLVVLSLALILGPILLLATRPATAPPAAIPPSTSPSDSCPDGADCPVKAGELLQANRGLSALPVGAGSGVVLDLPPELRTRNWGGGSCVHASNINLLLQNDMPELAAWWRKTYIGGEYSDRLIRRLEAAGLRYAWVQDASGRDSDGDGTTDGEEFFAWLQRTGRGAGIFYKPRHSINFVGMDEQYVYLLDNNATSYPEAKGHYERVPRAEFFTRWRAYGGFVWTIVAQPIPSRPYVEPEA